MLQLILPALLLLGSAPSAHGPALKCRDQPADGHFLYALDGELLGEDAKAVLAEIDTDDVHQIAILCMNPRDSTFNRTSGIPVMSIWTKEGPATRLEPTLNALVAAQDAYRRDHAAYADAVSELGLPPWPAPFRILIDARESGWTATITMDLYHSTCHVFDGDVPPPRNGMSARQPKCISGSPPG